MGIADESVKIFHGGWSGVAKPCGSCESAAALVFCRVDSAFLCAACDEKAHLGGGGGRRGEEEHHERVWMCEVCEQAPAAVTCKADAAALCASCDRDIHSANPLARRHDRLPIVPFFQPASSLLKSSPTFAASSPSIGGFLVQNGVVNHSANDEVHNKAFEEAEAASWILPNPSGSSNHKFADHDIKPNTELFLSDADPFLDFEYSASMDARFADSVVPVQKRSIPPPQLLNHRGASSENCFDLDFARSKLAPYSYAAAQSLSQSVSSDVGVVPDGNSMSDVSYPFAKQISNGNGNGDPNPSAGSQATQLSGTEREARVLRYREKRKNRKFEKTIRYASRKAYAESRPRIKGRFAKRTEMEADEVDACFYGGGSSAAAAFHLADSGYGVVPSF